MRVARVVAGLTAVITAGLGLSLATAGPASATGSGTWRAYGNKNPFTSSSSTWRCFGRTLAESRPVNSEAFLNGTALGISQYA